MGLGSLGQVAYDIIANDKTSEGIGSAKKGANGFVTTLGDVKGALNEVDGVAQTVSHGFASYSSYAEQASLATGLNADAAGELIKSWYSVDTPLDEAGKLLIELGRAGMTSAEEMKVVGDSCDTLGDALGVPADELANMLIPAMNAFGETAGDIPDEVDQIAYTLKNCNVNFGEWQKTMVKLGPDLSKMGLSMKDVDAIMAVMKDHGIQGKDMMSELTKAVSENSDTNQDGVVSFEEMCEAIGITTDEVDKQKQSLDGSTGTAEKWADASNKMYTASDSFAQAVSELSLNLGPLASGMSSVTGPLSMVSSGLLSLAALKSIGLGGMLSGVGTSLSGMAGSATAAVGALGPLAPILIGVGLGLAAVYVLKEVGFLDWVYEQGEQAGIGLNNFLVDLQVFTSETSWQFSQFGSSVGAAFASIPESISTALSGVPGALAAAFTDITTAFSALGGSVQTAFGNLFTGISDFIVGLAQGFIAAGYNIIMYIVQGMQSAAGAVTSTISGILGILSSFLPHSPAEQGPLSQLPNFSAYLVDPLLATTPAVTAAATQVAAAATMPVSQPADGGRAGTNIAYQDNSAPLSIGSVNASKDYSITDILTELTAVQASKRKQKGYRSTAG